MYEDPLLPLFAEGPRAYTAWPKSPFETTREIEYRPLSALLTTRFHDDAHVSAYSVPSVLRRLSTSVPAYAEIDGGVPMMVFLIDVDCAKAHAAMGGSSDVEADDAWWAALAGRVEALNRVHPGVVAYRTSGGGRIVMRPPAPHIVSDPASELEWKRLYLTRLAYLSRRFGIVADASIPDWTRCIRLPHVVRIRKSDGKRVRTWGAEMIGDPRRIGVLDYDPDASDEAADLAHARSLAARAKPWDAALKFIAGNVVATAKRAARGPRAVEPRAFDAGSWEALARDLGRVIATAGSGRHMLHRSLAGACYGRGVPYDRGPALARAIMEYSGETDDRPQTWETTAENMAAGRVVEGYTKLRATWPDVAKVLDTALPTDGGARAVRDELDARRFLEVPAADAAALVRSALETAAPGLRVVRITEGAGKTRSAAEVLRARAEAVATLPAIPSRAKSVYVAPSHAVAKEMAAMLRGVRGIYLRSPMAVRDGDDEAPACAYHVAVERLVRARHAASTWCDGKGLGHKGADDPCPHRETCAARLGAEVSLGGAGSPAVFVTVHALLGQVLAMAGPDALVVIDEDPQAVTAHEVTREALQAAADSAGLYMRRESWRFPVLRALAAGLERGALPQGDGQLLEVHRRGCEALADDAAWSSAAADAYGDIGADDMLRDFALRAVWYEKRTDEGTVWRRRSAWAPLPVGVERRRAFTGVVQPRLVDTSATHAVVAQLAAGVLRTPAPDGREHEERAVAAVEVSHADPSRRILRAVVASPAVAAAVSRVGPTVLLDATADIAVVGAVADAEVPVVDIRVADGSPVARRLLYWSGASRRGNLDAGEVTWSSGLLRYLRVAVGQCIEAGARRIGLFAWKAVADAIRAAAAPEVQELLRDVRALGAELVVGHYGAARGRNDWASCDGLVSIGDPKPNVGATRAVAAVLGLSADHGEVYRRATAAEVSQVAGRLRAPWRTAPAVHVHVGTVPPSSWDARASVLDLPPGVISSTDGRSVVEAVEVYGSTRDGAAAAGVSQATAARLKRAARANAGNLYPVDPHGLSHVTPVRDSLLGARDSTHGGVVTPLVLRCHSEVDDDCHEAPKGECHRVLGGEAGHDVPFATVDPRRMTAADLVAAVGGAAEAARMLEVSRTTPYHWVSGQRPIPPAYRQQLEAEVARRQAIPAAAPGATPAPAEPPGGAPTRPGVVRALPGAAASPGDAPPRYRPITTPGGW